MVAAGDVIFASDVNTLTDRDNGVLPQGALARGRRITSSGNITTTETGLLRVDNVPVYAGRLYRVLTSNLNIDSSGDNDVAAVRIRASTSGAATITSTIIGYRRDTIDNNSQSNVLPINCFWSPSADGTASFILTLIRQAGAGNLILFGSSTDICDMVISDEGLDPGDTGVVI